MQENPNILTFSPLGEPPRLIRRNGAGSGAVSRAASRIPAGHPEGYLEGFAQLYADIAEQIAARIENREPDPFSLAGAHRRTRRPRRPLHRRRRSILEAQGGVGFPLIITVPLPNLRF